MIEIPTRNFNQKMKVLECSGLTELWMGGRRRLESKAVSSHRTKKPLLLDSPLATRHPSPVTRWSFGWGDASMGIRAGDEAVDLEKRRCLRAVVYEEKCGAENGALAESKAVSSPRTPRSDGRLGVLRLDGALDAGDALVANPSG
jgi:hypothetical protein